MRGCQLHDPQPSPHFSASCRCGALAVVADLSAYWQIYVSSAVLLVVNASFHTSLGIEYLEYLHQIQDHLQLKLS